MHSLNWDDFRYVLTVVETGTVSGAAKKLGVNHATVVRRINAFEENQGFRIFEKTPTGYRVIPENMRIIDAMREVGAAVSATEGILAGHEGGVSGKLRVTATDTVCTYLLPPVLKRIAEAEPRLQVDLMSSNQTEDLGRMRADIAVRTMGKVTSKITGEIVGRIGLAVYGRKGADERLISVSGSVAQSRIGQHILQMAERSTPPAVADSFLVAAQLASHGIGRAVLPNFVGDRFPELERIKPVDGFTSVPLWATCHTEMAGVTRIATLLRLLSKELKREIATYPSAD
ncbi:LysR family transcriptional regulator [Actibacterium pelagium]|uniref:LysR family transcriptional regulator n=1 Tax=Actibacterium pelagium TaxID=2029103 RepID=A0A917ADI1_9RHOB|nr:LysR family transcriptional regulator [Actibacterium pelagium]GGE42968.1 LysR family transcriptional regulator [Actibacterium pelagium]